MRFAKEKPYSKKKKPKVLTMTWGWIVVDKPTGQTSMTATRRIKRLLGVKKAGHAGTLDPLASGILPVALGPATSLIPFMMEEVKAYEFTVSWGARTTTDDSEGEICAVSNLLPGEASIQKILPLFKGSISQVPPQYCAVKLKGQPAYAYARKGHTLELAPRFIQIRDLQLKAARGSEADFYVICSTGTYVRSLARDLAHALGTEGHITRLRRTQAGPFSQGKSQEVSLDFLEGIDYKERIKYVHLPQVVLKGVPEMNIEAHHKEALWHGRALHMPLEDGIWACYEKETLVALARYQEGSLRPTRCFKGEA